MTTRSNPSRKTATMIGYHHLCDELEAENQALIVQIQELRARLCGRVPPAFAPLGSLHGIVTLSNGERKKPEALGISSGRDGVAPRIHRRRAEGAMRLGRGGGVGR